MKQYILENDVQMPLCAVINDNYIDYLTGQVIDNENTLNFIQRGLERKTLLLKKLNFTIYQVVTVSENTRDRKLIGYNYVINGCTNYLDKNKKTVSNSDRQHIVNNILENKYKMEVIWE